MLNRSKQSDTVSPFSQATLESLLSLASPQMPFSTVLADHGFEPHLKNVEIHLNNQPIDFTGCHFHNVTFKGTSSGVDFSNTSFTHSTFDSTQYSHAHFNHSQFSECTFINSQLNYNDFLSTTFSGTKSWGCDFSGATFMNSTIEDSIFAKPKFDNVLEFNNQSDNMHIIFNQDYSVNGAFNLAEKHLINPSIALLEDPDWHSGPHYVLDQYGAEPVSLSNKTTSTIDELLRTEVELALTDIHENGLNAPSIAQHILNSDQETINTIKDWADTYVKSNDAVWIPGGPDIHPEFYGEANTQSYPSSSYYREILEFSLLDAAITQDKPVIGVCHGFQLTNVYLGGTLHQHVDGHSGIRPELTLHTQEGLLGEILSNPTRGPSYHHQAIKDLAPNLEVVASYDGVIKAAQATDGKQLLLFQYHPEYRVDQSSKNVLKEFVDLSADSKILAKALEIDDILQLSTGIDFLGNQANNKMGSSMDTILSEAHSPQISQFANLPELQPASEIVV